MNLIEQLEKLPRVEMEVQGCKFKIILDADLRAIIERAKLEAVEPVAVPEGYKLVPIEPTEKMLDQIALVDSFSYEALRVRYKAMLSAAPEDPQPDHTKLIGELVSELSRAQEALEYYEDCTGIRHDNGVQFTIGGVLTKSREAIK